MKRQLICGALVVAAVAGWVAVASAAEGYGMGGCGLGSLIFGDSPGKVSQILASTTNGFLGNQTFAITSGTSNCDPSAGAVGVRRFIETNREALAKDAARGAGETVAGLSALAGCRDVGAVGAALQQNFGSIFPSAGVADERVSATVLGLLRADAGLGCDQIL